MKMKKIKYKYLDDTEAEVILFYLIADPPS